MSDPERWSDNAAALTPAERRAFAAGQRGPAVPAAAQSAVWKGLATAMAASSAAAATGSSATALTATALLKPFALGALLGVAVAGGAAVYERAVAQRPAPSAKPLSSTALPPPSAVRPSAAQNPKTSVEASAARERAATVDRARAAVRLEAAPSAREPAVADGSGQASFPANVPDGTDTAESRRLVAARALLRAGRVQSGLSALAAIRTDFPNGALAQEREALTIEALLAAGDPAQARARAAAFLERYPESPHASSVRKALK